MLYHFQVIPVRVPSSYLKTINQALVTFFWAQKTPWLAQSILQFQKLLKLLGGMALPDPNLYHMACHLTRVLEFFHHGSLKQWV